MKHNVSKIYMHAVLLFENAPLIHKNATGPSAILVVYLYVQNVTTVKYCLVQNTLCRLYVCLILVTVARANKQWTKHRFYIYFSKPHSSKVFI